jgi:hypothetical protein
LERCGFRLDAAAEPEKAAFLSADGALRLKSCGAQGLQFYSSVVLFEIYTIF